MTDIAGLLHANKRHVEPRTEPAGREPVRRLAVLTCMDTRIDVLAAFGLRLGEAVVLRNAGGRVTDDVLRSLAVATHSLGVDTVVVMQHSECGVSGVTGEGLRTLTGADLDFLPIDDHAATLRQDIELIAAKPYLESVKEMAGFVYDVASGKVDDLVRWERSA